ncbi:MAG: GAF domain-containing protein, partial [Pseudobdellovibrionaceae bacterium]|nr:GAF domain-containing protein [Pseudobdellovibrionaceae bacterium]
MVYEGPSFLFQHASSEERPPETYEGIKYRFVHDRVQQACHTLFSEEEIRKIKLRYGRYLLKNSDEDDVKKNLIVQIAELHNGGLEYISDADERSFLVNLNLLAARKSAASLSYGSAVKFARFGLKLLEEIGEEGYSDTYRNLMLIAAEAEHINQNAEAADQLFERLLSKGGDPYSLALIYEKKTALCGMTGQYEKACLSGLEALKVLNVNLPAKPYPLHGIIQTMRVLQLAAKLRKKNLLSKRILSPPVDDERHKLIISVLESIQFSAYQHDINLFTLVTAYATRIILKKGNTEGASNFYTTLALFTLLVTKNTTHSAEIADMGVEYGRVYEPNQCLAKTLFSNSYALLHWSKDVKESTSRYFEAEKLLIQSGEVTWLDSARASRLFYFTHHASYTQDLVKSAFEMQGVTQLKISQAAKPAYCFVQQYLRVMNGQVSNIVDFHEVDDWQKETIDTAMQKNPTTSTRSAYLVGEAQASVIFNLYEEAVTSLKHCELNKILGTISVAYHNFFLGLCASALHQKQVMGYWESRRKLHSALNKFRKWALDVPVNFKHFALILEAELRLFKGQYLKATALYDEAISTAEQYSYFWVAGLAADRCAEMYLGLKQQRLAEPYLKLAYGFYQTYGATGKLKQLLANHPNAFSKANQTNTNTALNKTFHGTIAHTDSQTYQHGDVLDVTAITRAAQAISGSIRIDELLSKLVAILRQTAGGNRCVLLLPTKDGFESRWHVVAQSIDSDEPRIMLQIPYQESLYICSAICEYVIRSKLPLVLGDPLREGAYTQNEYIMQQRPQSILCMPIVNRNNPVALIYLENRTSTHAFTSERIELITTLGSQAAISIENALLYAGMEKQVAERTARLNEKTREVRSILLNIELGIFTIGISPDGSKIIMDPEYSVYLKAILE